MIGGASRAQSATENSAGFPRDVQPRRGEATEPGVETVPVVSSLIGGNVVAAVEVVEGFSGIADVGDGAGITDRVEGVDRVPAVLEQDAVRHRRSPVDPHVAVHEEH